MTPPFSARHVSEVRPRCREPLSFVSLDGRAAPHCKDAPRFVQSVRELMDTLGCFHVLALVNNASVTFTYDFARVREFSFIFG